MDQKLWKEWAYIRRALQLQAGHYDSMGAVEYPTMGFIQTERAGENH